MTRNFSWMSLLLALLLSPLFGKAAHAQNINAAFACSQSDVQSALNSVSADGTTVAIPSCNPTNWTTTRHV